MRRAAFGVQLATSAGDGVAFPGEADCIEVELADRLARGCYPVGKAVAVN